MILGNWKVNALCILFAVYLCSCTVCEPQTGIPLVVRFTVDGMEADMGTKSQDMAESALRDINLYIVNELGHVVSWGYYLYGSGITADIYDGMDYKLYAVANAGRPLVAKDVAGIESLSFRVAGGDMLSGSGGYVLMSGMLPLQRLSGGSSVTVPLERCAAKVLLKCDFSALNSDVEINVSSVRLRNIPAGVNIFGKNRIVSPEGAVDGETFANPSAALLSGGIPFYLFENMQGNLQPGNVEQSGKVWPDGSLNSQICSYVEMTATYSSPRKAGGILYRFYLGKDMVSNYDVERNVQYNITVSFKGDGAVGENSWRVDNSGIKDVIPPDISFSQTERVMYDLEEGLLLFSKLQPADAIVEASSSNASVLQVLDASASGVKIKALAPGEAVVTARTGGVSTACRIRVEKLRIVPKQGAVVLYNHFYTDILYTVLPEHASSLEVKFATSSTSLVPGYGGIAGRVIPQYPFSADLPAAGTVTLSIAGREDVSANISVTVNPMLLMNGTIAANANMGSTAGVKGLGLSTSPRAQVNFSWVPSDGITLYGDPGSNVVVSASDNNVTFPVPNGANGRYRLKAQVVGDDGYGTNEASQPDAVKYCDISIYETIYLVGVSKTMNREKTGADPDKWTYENEVVAKWLSHPLSQLFPNGELNLNLGFVYKGVEYSDNHTEFSEVFTFTFEKGDYIEYALDAGQSVYNGTAPQYYMEYFFLEPAVSPYVQGSLADGTPFLYIYSRNFASGFSKTPSPGWDKIFEYVYP